MHRNGAQFATHARQEHDGVVLNEVDLHVALHGTEAIGGCAFWAAVAADTERWDAKAIVLELPVAQIMQRVLCLVPDDHLSSKSGKALGKVRCKPRPANPRPG